MKTASLKQKARLLQKWVQNLLLVKFRTLTNEDIRSTGMGQNGEDLQMSPAARELFPFSIECKARKTFAIYSMYKQAQNNCNGAEPLLIIKGNHKPPLAVVDAELFIKSWINKEKYE